MVDATAERPAHSLDRLASSLSVNSLDRDPAAAEEDFACFQNATAVSFFSSVDISEYVNHEWTSTAWWRSAYPPALRCLSRDPTLRPGISIRRHPGWGPVARH